MTAPFDSHLARHHHPSIFKPHESEPRSFTAPAFQRSPCACPKRVWLCKACGTEIKGAILRYQRAWNFRSRYPYRTGGLGTGVGEGIEGMECARGPLCLAAKLVEQEVNYDLTNKTGYNVQEIEGVGGGVQRISRQCVPVGDSVQVYKDEEGRTMIALGRETSGQLRSWCGWCNRVIPSKQDIEDSRSSGLNFGELE
jgi:hypothetical protein